MPFVEVNIKEEIEKHCQESPSFAKAWSESSPSLKLFCSMLNALGYELQIVKKQNI